MAAAQPLPEEILLTTLTLRRMGKDGTEKVTRHSYSALDGSSDPALVLEHEFQVGCGLYPADLVRKTGGFNAALRGAEDHDFHIRLVLAGGRFRALNASFNTYCAREGEGWSRTHEERMRSDWHQVLLHYARILPPHCHSTLSRLTMENAYKLYAAGRPELALEAIQSARSLGRIEVNSRHKWLRRLSRFTGPLPIFWFRRLLN
jgi:GT2 family glycosyltransferase